MKRQRGMTVGWFAAIVFALSVGGTFVWGKTMQIQRDKVTADFKVFKAELAAAAAQAELVRKGQEYEDQQRKIEADAKRDRSLARLHADNQRLRDAANARGPVLPAARSGAPDPERACINRAEFERAYRQLTKELRAIGEAGDTARLNLDAAKAWAQAHPKASASPPR